MNNQKERTRELKFKCPECGSNKLIAWVGGKLDIDHVYDNGLFSWGDLYIKNLEDVVCAECGYAIEPNDEESWIEWLITHCDQDESEAGPAEGLGPPKQLEEEAKC